MSFSETIPSLGTLVPVDGPHCVCLLLLLLPAAELTVLVVFEGSVSPTVESIGRLESYNEISGIASDLRSYHIAPEPRPLVFPELV